MGTQQRTPDLTFVRLIHQALRIDGARLVTTVTALGPEDRTSRVARVRAFYDKYREELVAHHTHEDTLYYPALAARVGADRMHLDELMAQHHQLDDVLNAIDGDFDTLADPASDFTASRARLSGDLARMVDSLTMHLDFEERTALPLFESAMPIAEYKELEKKARKMMRSGQATFLIPWLATHATPEQRKAWFKSAPPLRVVAWVNGRSYRRIDEVLLPA